MQRLEEDTPSIVAVATERGAQLVEVSVSMDGELLTSRIDGRSLAVDPGMHEFTFSTAQGGTHTEKVLILQGQRNRVISVELEATPAAERSSAPPVKPASESPPSAAIADENSAPFTPGKTSTPPRSVEADTSHAPVLAYVVGGAGLAAIGGSFLLAHWGHEDNLRLDRCAPNCSPDSVDHVSRMYVAADITLGVGVLALGAATWLYLASPGAEEPETDQAYRFDIRPTSSGAFATVGSAF